MSEPEHDAIAHAAGTLNLNVEEIVAEARHAGTLAIVLVAKLRAAVAKTSAAAASKVHLGSTSQDVMDTVSVIHCKRATGLLTSTGWKLCDALAHLAELHVDTPMLGRTLLRGARPITFGLKVSNWLTGLVAALVRLQADANALSLQLGGAVGTLAGLDDKGTAVATQLANDLGLRMDELPWHTRRNDTVALGTSLAIVAGACSKIATDVALLGQDEVAEVFEARQPGRGGSSTMPHKRNPTGSQQTLLATSRVPALAHSLLENMGQEHERGIAGWQAETGILAEMFVWTNDALLHSVAVVEGLECDPAAMRKNLTAAGIGNDYGEAQNLTVHAISNYRGRRA